MVENVSFWLISLNLFFISYEFCHLQKVYSFPCTNNFFETWNVSAVSAVLPNQIQIWLNNFFKDFYI